MRASGARMAQFPPTAEIANYGHGVSHARNYLHKP